MKFFKFQPARADTVSKMMISDEQVRRVVEYLQTTERESAIQCEPDVVSCVPDDLVERACRAAIQAPEVRSDRIEHAREMLAGAAPSSSDVAAKLIGRVISDSLR